MGKMKFTCSEIPGSQNLAEMVIKPVVTFVNEQAGKELVKEKELVKSDELIPFVKKGRVTTSTKIEKSVI